MPRPGQPVDHGRIVQGLRAGKYWIVAGAVFGLIVAFGLARWVAPRLYLAETALVFELAVPAESEAEAARQLRTMVDGIALPQNLIALRDRLGRDEDTAQLAAQLEIDYDRESNLVTIGATDTSARGAAMLANTAAAVFVEHRREFESARRKEVVGALEDDLRRAQDVLAVARAEYDAFRRANGIADLSAETQRAIEAAASMRAQADLAQGEVAAEQSRARAIAARPRTPQAVAAVEASAEQRAVQQRLAQARLELVEARARFSDEHPEVQRLQAMIGALRQQRAAAPPPVVVAPAPEPAPPRRIARPVGVSSSRAVAAQERQRAYAKLAAAAEERLQLLSEKQGEAARLLANQQVAETHLSELNAFRARAIDEARSPVTGLRVLAPAVPPERPEKSVAQPMLFVVMPLAFALLFAIVIVLRRLLRLRVHTAREAAYWGKGVTVASTGWPKSDEAPYWLITEIADSAVHAHGTTLVVAASEDDAHLARSLASDLNAATAPSKEETEEHPAEVVIVPDTQQRRPTVPLGLPATAGTATGGTRATMPYGVVTPLAAPGTLARRVSAGQEVRVRPHAFKSPIATFSAWGGGGTTQASLRRLARLADRVLVLVRSGTTTIKELTKLRQSLARDSGVGFVVVDLDDSLQELPDRAGSVEAFWRGSKE